MKPALLVIDVQKEFFKRSPITAQSLDSAIEYINAAIALFRAKGLPVICVQDKDVESNVVPGTEGFDLPDRLKILPSDLHIVKTYGNAFNKTPLADALRAADVDTLIVTGFCAEYCVLSTYSGPGIWISRPSSCATRWPAAGRKASGSWRRPTTSSLTAH